ncbi:NAD-dependent protein deacetylase Sirt6 [Diorhabda sublineata]|uniref:NAD-dependent protein deacetylase Sirt6 n=1 Tax=Diorhabda sublineata TaxID=1163346 RepID=UPI0024E0CD84|nr:NAD-dependent protein deacetylase Sirt6 [Diorhabda sublineata]
MSCNYADGLSEYENKGILGTPEKFDSEEKVNEKCELLVQWMKDSKHIVVHTGAGISTSAGIPDFRGPSGVWTLEKQGKKPNINISFNDAKPTKTHMAIKSLIEKNIVQYVISQNIDGLHLRSGLSRQNIAELHGNMFVGQCNTCERQFVRSEATTTVGKKCLNEDCKRSSMLRGRTCRGKLYDTILDWEDNLPENDLEMSDYHSSLADLNICLGTTLQIVPSGNLPLRCQKYGGKVVIVNLQPTKHDKKADLIINTYVDDVLTKVMKKLNLEIPDYSFDIDPTKNQLPNSVIEWNISKPDINTIKLEYDKLVKYYKKRKSEEKLLNNSKIKPKIKKLSKGSHVNRENIIKSEIKIRKKADNTKNENSIEQEKKIIIAKSDLDHSVDKEFLNLRNTKNSDQQHIVE